MGASARSLAVGRAVRLEWLTVLWMTAEAVLSIGVGVAARSVVLTAFGVDSVVELLSGVVLLWRLRADGAGASGERINRAEHRATQISAVLLVLLCGFVVVSSVAGVLTGVRPEATTLGIAVAASALVAMPLLAAAKARANRALDSAALRADVAESITCAYMAAVTLAGLAASGLTGLWWLQYAAAVALLIWLVPETREAIEAARGERSG